MKTAVDNRELSAWSAWTACTFSAILIGIWQSQAEIASAIAEGGIDYSLYLGPLWVKLVKDGFLAALWLYLVTVKRDYFPKSVRNAIASLYLISAIASAIACFTLSPVYAAAGLRWILPAFVVLEMRRLYGTSFNVTKVVQWLFLLLLAHLLLQFARLFYFPPVWGERWGFPARVPGFFLLPNTGAFFAVAAAAVAIDLAGIRYFWARAALVIAFLSAVVSQSAGGLLACLVLFAYVSVRSARLALLLVAIPAGLFLSASSSLLGREDFLEYSGGERIEKLYVAASELAGPGAFGTYTNTGFMLAASDAVSGAVSRDPVISDSFYVSLIGNFGVLSPLFLLILIRALALGSRHLRQSGRRLGVASLLCLSIFGFSTVVTEAFPMIVMLGAGIWFCPPVLRVSRRSQRRKIHGPPAQGGHGPSALNGVVGDCDLSNSCENKIRLIEGVATPASPHVT